MSNKTKRVRFTTNTAASASSKPEDYNDSDNIYDTTAPSIGSDSENDLLEADISKPKKKHSQKDISDSDLEEEEEEEEEEEMDNGPEDEDMFAEQPNKRKRYLDLDDIEGQEPTTDYKGKQPLDNQGDMEAFNMREDLEEGKFDTEGNFIWNEKDPQTHQDDWLEGITQKDIDRANESHHRQQTQLMEGAEKWDTMTNDDLIVSIINLLRPHETVFNGLSRLGGTKKKKNKNKWKKKNPKDQERKQGIERLTELADQAMIRGIPGVYEKSYEQFVRQMRMVGRIPDNWEIGTTLEPTENDIGLLDGL